MKKFVEGLHAVHTSRLQCKKELNMVTAKNNRHRWYHNRSLGRFTKPRPIWYSSPSSQNAPCYRPQGSQCQPRLRHRVCRVEEVRVRWASTFGGPCKPLLMCYKTNCLTFSIPRFTQPMTIMFAGNGPLDLLQCGIIGLYTMLRWFSPCSLKYTHLA